MTSEVLRTIEDGPARFGTSVELGQERIAYLDRWAAFRGLRSRADALISMWPRGEHGAFTRPKLPPPRAPLPVLLRAFHRPDWPTDRHGRPISAAQLSGPGWREGDTADKIDRLKDGPPAVSLSRLCRAVIDAHAAVYAQDMLDALDRGRSG